jgi:predicted nucleic acid-binding protein
LTVVVDTSVLIDHLRGDNRARAALARAQDEGLAASVLTQVEILAGMRPAEEHGTRVLFGAIEWLDVDEDLAARAGALAQRYLRSHPGVEVVDYVIAATTERLGARLLTRNRNHFPMFAELDDPYAPRA